jgi:hypothetical protein
MGTGSVSRCAPENWTAEAAPFPPPIALTSPRARMCQGDATRAIAATNRAQTTRLGCPQASEVGPRRRFRIAVFGSESRQLASMKGYPEVHFVAAGKGRTRRRSGVRY